MSKLYASIDADSSQTEATRRGRKRITTHTRGWDVGVRVHAWVGDDEKVPLNVYRTTGSNGSGGQEPVIAQIVEGER